MKLLLMWNVKTRQDVLVWEYSPENLYRFRTRIFKAVNYVLGSETDKFLCSMALHKDHIEHSDGYVADDEVATVDAETLNDYQTLVGILFSQSFVKKIDQVNAYLKKLNTYFLVGIVEIGIADDDDKKDVNDDATD